MDLERPDGFDRTAAWWNPVVGDDVARHVQPVGTSSDGRLYVMCSNLPWATNMRLLAPTIAGRLNAVHPGRVLAQELDRARVLEGSALFLSTPGVREEFASRCGPHPRAAASAA